MDVRPTKNDINRYWSIAIYRVEIRSAPLVSAEAWLRPSCVETRRFWCPGPGGAGRQRRDVLPLFCTCMCIYIYCNIIFMYIYIWIYIYIYPYIQYSYFCPLNMICLQLFCICLLFCTMLWVWKWWFSRFAGLATSTFHHLFEFFDPPVITRWSFGLARTSDQKGNPHAPGELQICCGRSEFQLSLGPGR